LSVGDFYVKIWIFLFNHYLNYINNFTKFLEPFYHSKIYLFYLLSFILFTNLLSLYGNVIGFFLLLFFYPLKLVIKCAEVRNFNLKFIALVLTSIIPIYLFTDIIFFIHVTFIIISTIYLFLFIPSFHYSLRSQSYIYTGVYNTIISSLIKSLMISRYRSVSHFICSLLIREILIREIVF
jgi:hypothetical protein